VKAGPGIAALVGGSPSVRAAVSYARRRHGGQRRAADEAPFITHPLEVAALLHEAGAPEHVVAAGVLHDVIEKTGAEPADLRRRFGRRVATLVQAVSEDPRIPAYEARKAALRARVASAGADAQLVFAADKVANVRELLAVTEHPARPGEAPAATRQHASRLTHYRSCLQLLEAHLPDSPLVEQLRTELACLTELQPALAGMARA
jgi:(p)ppGpp synthase/HD superfamily hydrolase